MIHLDFSTQLLSVTPDKSSSISTPDQCCHACFFLPNPYAIFFGGSACYFIPPNAILVASCTQLTLDFHHPSTWPVPIKRPSFCTNTGPLVSRHGMLETLFDYLSLVYRPVASLNDFTSPFSIFFYHHLVLLSLYMNDLSPLFFNPGCKTLGTLIPTHWDRISSNTCRSVL
jgi:hypothetical protein